MALRKEHLVLAIDGGGTRSRFALACGDERVVFEGGSANAFSDFDATMRCVRDGVAAVSRQAGLIFEQVCRLPTFVGLAGLSEPGIVKRAQAALPFVDAEFADDRRSALCGALGRFDGVVAHCGTGSFFASRFDQRERFAGGWGAVLGDEASAQWVGRKALSLTLQSVDGFLEPSDLTNQVFSKLGGVAGILDCVATASPREFGEFAPLVTELAMRSDPVAKKIMQDGAGYIANGLGQMGWRNGCRICLTGGIAKQFEPYLSAEKQADVEPPVGTPLDGAIALAQARLERGLV